MSTSNAGSLRTVRVGGATLFMHMPMGYRTDVTRFVHKILEDLEQAIDNEDDCGEDWPIWARDFGNLWVSTTYLSHPTLSLLTSLLRMLSHRP